jgi:hypothetical protein
MRKSLATIASVPERGACSSRSPDASPVVLMYIACITPPGTPRKRARSSCPDARAVGMLKSSAGGGRGTAGSRICIRCPPCFVTGFAAGGNGQGKHHDGARQDSRVESRGHCRLSSSFIASVCACVAAHNNMAPFIELIFSQRPWSPMGAVMGGHAHPLLVPLCWFQSGIARSTPGTHGPRRALQTWSVWWWTGC